MAKTAQKKIRSGVIIAGLILLFFLVPVVFHLRPQLARWLATPTPTLACVRPTLHIGASDFEIQPLAPLEDGSFAIPNHTAHLAYWLEGTNIHFVFGLSDMTVNDVLMGLYDVGETVSVTWADCGQEEYVITSIETDVALDESFLDQSAGGISIYIPQDANTARIVVRGTRPGLLVTSSPEPTDANAVQMDISFTETSVSGDKTSVSFLIRITNRGAQAITLKDGDIDLQNATGEVLAPLVVVPSLPVTIPRGGTATVQVVFPYPGPPSAVLRILDQTMEFYYQ